MELLYCMNLLVMYNYLSHVRSCDNNDGTREHDTTEELYYSAGIESICACVY